MVQQKSSNGLGCAGYFADLLIIDGDPLADVSILQLPPENLVPGDEPLEAVIVKRGWLPGILRAGFARCDVESRTVGYHN
jgi:hypothetical protein